ncbi:MAG: hypothetical protein NUW12_10995 [Firmicutes bacterium]|nr:hypothetical protein [Bacillota bacterium]MDH7496508.1 hypothetical protein [Bacillota bacterium]
MKLFGLDARKIAAAFFVTLAVLTGGRIAAYHIQVERPLEALLEGRSDVAAWRLVKSDGPTDVEVRVVLRDVRNIQTTLLDLGEDIAGMTRGAFRLVVEDTRNAELTETYQRMRLAVEEAIARGTFREMAQEIESQAIEAGLDRCGVYVDSQNVYLQLHKGERYLYEVIPRRKASALPDDTASSLSGVSARR